MTKKQREVYDFIESFITANRFSPSYDEIGQACNLKSKNSVSRYVHKLSDAGLILFDPRCARSIELVRAA